MSHKFLTPKLTKLILAVAICLILVFFVPGDFFSPVRGIFLKAAYPFQKTCYIISRKTGNFFDLISSISDLKKENERIIKENWSLAAKVADLESQKKENEDLRSQLELAPRRDYGLEAAYIIGRDPRGSGSWMIIDKGSSRGIAENMPVIVSDGILIGKVSEVHSRSSKINLLTDSSSSVNVSDVETQAKGILSGKYNLGLSMEMVQQTDVLNVGDKIVTSGLGGDMPPGFLIGKIQKIESTQDKLFQQALIEPEIRYFDLDVVFVVKNSN